MLVGMKPAAPTSKAEHTSLGSSRSENMTRRARGRELARGFDQCLLLIVLHRGAANAENDHLAGGGFSLSIELIKSIPSHGEPHGFSPRFKQAYHAGLS